jgi:phage baseplate assembly protein W
MAFQPQHIDPIDLKPQRAVGVSLPFNGPGVFRNTYTTTDQIKYNLINYFLTNKGERVFNKRFGGDFRRRVFDNITNNDIDLIREQVEDSFLNYFPNLKLEEAIVLGNPEKNQVSVSIKYTITNSNLSDEITLNFSNG